MGSNPTIENMAPGSVRMANPLRPPVWVQVKSRARCGRAATGIAGGGGERDVGPATRPRAEGEDEVYDVTGGEKKLVFDMRHSAAVYSFFLCRLILFGKSRATSLPNCRGKRENSPPALPR